MTCFREHITFLADFSCESMMEENRKNTLIKRSKMIECSLLYNPEKFESEV